MLLQSCLILCQLFTSHKKCKTNHLSYQMKYQSLNNKVVFQQLCTNRQECMLVETLPVFNNVQFYNLLTDSRLQLHKSNKFEKISACNMNTLESQPQILTYKRSDASSSQLPEKYSKPANVWVSRKTNMLLRTTSRSLLLEDCS